MNFNQATLYARQGYTILLPNWKGYFNWDYNKRELVFKNGDYNLSEKELIDKGLDQRTDWYYIV